MNIIKPLEKTETLHNAIFLAGPTPRFGIKYKNDCRWREEIIFILEKQGFEGDVIDPFNVNFDRSILKKQIDWEIEMMYKSSLVLFWIPRSDEHPAFTTNVEFGTWLNNTKSFVLGYPKESIKNEYLAIRYEEETGRKPFSNLEDIVSWSIDYLQNRKQNIFFTSDTHFSQERTLKLSARPFKDVKSMDLQLISNWNKKITMNDIVYHLGDFGNTEIVKLLNFKKMYFIPGNYEDIDGYGQLNFDKRVVILNKDENGNNPGFYDKQNGEYYNLVHEPFFDIKEERYHHSNDLMDEEFYLYGHIHRLQLVKRNGINVGCDGLYFAPISLEELRFIRTGIEDYFDENVFIDKCY